jgi:hypothetical protein
MLVNFRRKRSYEKKLEAKVSSFKQAGKNMEKKEISTYTALPVSRSATLKEDWIENFVEV